MNRNLRALVIGVSFRTALCFAFAISLLVPTQSICAAQQPAAGRTQTARLLAWYDTLGFPDTAGRAYVRVTTGWWRQVSNEPGNNDGTRENQYVEGFLLREDAESFTVFISGVNTLGAPGKGETLELSHAPLSVFRFVRKADGPEYERVLYERIDLVTRARDVLDRGRSFAAATKSEESKRNGDRYLLDSGLRGPTQRAQIFVLACAARQNGLQREASALFELIERRLPVEINDRNLLHELQRSIGEAVFAQMQVNALDPSYSREQMLQAYSTFAKRFPDHGKLTYPASKVPYTRAAAQVLQRMVTEGKAHPARSISTLTPPQQAAEWIYRLRDLQLGMSYWTRGAPYPMDPFDPRDESQKTPVHHLVDLGDAAVPALLDALADESFTRTALASFKGGSPYLMRVSDFAIIILEFMAGRTFRADPAAGNAAARPVAEAWWGEIQSGGAKQRLMDDTAAGGGAGMSAASKLVQRYPESALGPIEIALSNTSSKSVRAQLLAISATIPGDSVLPLLRAQLVPEAGWPARNIAARELLVRGYRDGVPVMIQAWHDLQPLLRDPLPPLTPLHPNGAGGTERDDPLRDVGDLIAFLAGCDELRAIEALAGEDPKATVDVRLGIVRAFLPPDQSMVMIASERLGPHTRPSLIHPAAAVMEASPQAVDAAIKKLLRSALQDTYMPQQMRIQQGSKTLDALRIGDIAALVLAPRWTERYVFDLSAEISARDVAISVMLNLDRN